MMTNLFYFGLPPEILKKFRQEGENFKNLKTSKTKKQNSGQMHNIFYNFLRALFW